ncbi:transcriptional regulator, PaaX family [Quadrisphaera granulorum]|uniref:PaaX family transcriptional regulator n=1 Tax=Quadrisphaera granulorum TaxID=317664 RepID=A0A316A1Q0_9ACTN|nr:PaaX family transcriptional regulator C-terminal domain-containing protein [Quadrisphaera granulorum]PWJ51158.1 PaaX family transcriptional regulator [Quadrisphaera granulorum]SZE97808.1 transcriptional regulator, PaaX family [Quadrisphaera granulorum]
MTSALEAVRPAVVEGSVLARKPRQLLLALFGEYVCDQYFEPLRTSVLIGALEPAGFAAPAVRTSLDRMVESGMLARRRLGREVGFELTASGVDVLRGASERVKGAEPFAPQGEGWTVVAFTLPEDQRALRHRLRAALTWAGFAALRDGLWIAPGAVDLAAVLDDVEDELPPGAVTAFAASELPGYPMADAVRVAWDVAGIRRAHEEFIAAWEHPDAAAGLPALTRHVLLVADWLALLRVDPRLPPQYMGEDWPATRSVDVFTARHRAFAFPGVRDFAARVS